MANCLGLYIEDNIIKYAKVSKDHDELKVESFGIKFYEKLSEAINQIIVETYSQKTPISINLAKESYNYFNMFSLLTKQDLEKAIKTEFESYCTDKGYNPNVFETRYAFANNKDEKDKIKVIHVSSNTIELNKQMQEFVGYKLANVSPISMTIPNLIGSDLTGSGNAIIVNIEDTTTITTILSNTVYNIDILEEGSKDILANINLKENSYSKSYEICKNTTIYTSEGKELLDATETGYLEDIMPTLYNITSAIRKIMENTDEKFEKVYITGTGAVINNVDLYFQENISEAKCEILKPYFIQSTKELSIKDYQEVNSAISLALQGLGEGIAGINFRQKKFGDGLPSWLKIETSSNNSTKEKSGLKSLLVNDLGQKLDKTEISLIRVAAAVLILVLLYGGFSAMIDSGIKSKETEVSTLKTDTQSQISLANKDNEKIKTRTNEYTTMIKNLEDLNDKISDRTKTRNAIPNLLNQIMYIIPTNVQITSIENTTGTHVQINAQSDKYEQLGYLIAKIKSDAILTNVTSTSGQKENNVVAVLIEGDLP